MNFFVWLFVLVSVISVEGNAVTSEGTDNDKLDEVSQFEPLHLRMKRSELEEYFGVSSHDEVPEYEVTSPFQADENGKFLSHNLDVHARQKRGTEEPRAWYYNVKAFGMSLHLNLTKNEDLMAPGTTVDRYYNGTVTSEDPPQNSFFNGYVISVPKSSVAVSNENGLTGIIQLMDQTLFLQPLASHLMSDSNPKGNHHLVFRRSLDNKNMKEIDPGLSGWERESTQDEEFWNEPKSKRNDDIQHFYNDMGLLDKQHFYIEMGLLADKSIIKKYGLARTKTLALRLANLLNTIYHDRTIGHKKITIKVAAIKLVEDGLDYGSSPSNQAKLKALKAWTEAKIPASKRPDVMALISRGGVGGLADFNSICKRTSYAVNNDMGLQTVQIVAHETAHTLGINHDGSGNPSCPDGKYVMSSAVPGGKTAAKWSPCSRQAIQALLSKNPSCLLDGGKRRSTNYKTVFRNLLPGKLVTADEQCTQQYGDGYRQCKYKLSDCGSLYCTSDGSSCISKIAPPLEGTYCAPRHWCISGECVDDGSQKVDGGWSSWSKKWGGCSRTCGGGIQWKTRTCTNPSPKNGGEDCEGDSTGFPRICKTKPCPSNSIDYRVKQCQAHDPKYTQFYYRGGPDACNLYCRQGMVYAPKGRVKDGTKCRPGSAADNLDICIGGKCTPVGCDYGIGSGASIDRCGVCNGDSTTCSQVMKTFTEDWQQKGVENARLAHVVPKGSRTIWVYEKGVDRNNIGLQDAKKAFLLDPGRFRKITAAGSEITYGKKDNREYMYTPGPTTGTLRVMFVYKGSKNQGVVVKYLRRKKSVITGADVKWVIDEQSGWSACSESCAGGKQTRKVTCKRKDDGSIVKKAVCEKGGLQKPADERSCNTQPCPADWHLSSWSSCSTTCGHGRLTRTLSCKRKVKNPDGYQTVSTKACQGSKPTDLSKSCYAAPCPAEWVPSNWGECSKTCGGGVMTRTLSCQKPSGDGQFSPVPNYFCQGAVKPPVSEACNTDVLCKGSISE